MYWMDMTEQQIADTIGGFGMPKFRAAQVKDWLKKGVRPQEMRNLPKDLRDRMDTIPFGGAVIYEKRVSPKDGTVKYLFELEDGNLVEGVLMRYSYGNTVCLSTQVGCNMGCKFCASTLEGCVRSLRPGEMLSVLAEIERDEPPADGKPRTVTNIVLMGSGEPLDNYDNVMRAIEVLTADWGFGWSPKRITLSSIGVLPNLKRYLDGSRCHLAISLHDPFPEERVSIMPVEKAWQLADIVRLIRQYDFSGQRRVSFEYIMFSGFNDSKRHADALIRLLRGLECRVNLIRFHKIPDFPYETSPAPVMEAFRDRLDAHGITCTIRASRGEDILAACGMLAGKHGKA